MGVLAWILGFVPGIIWLAYFYRKDRFDPEPIGWVLVVFIAGAVVVFPVVAIEKALTYGIGVEGIGSTADAAAVSWVIAGLVEEAAKLGVVLALVFYRRNFDEPMDGMVYAAAAALGFASVENVSYIQKFGAQVILMRGPLATLGHLLFSCIWGYALGKAKFSRARRLAIITKGFVLSAFFHGLYDFLIFTNIMAALSVYLVSVVLWKMMVQMVAEAQTKSPFAE